MPHADFVHLRVHSAYSLSEGALRVKDIVSLCQRHQMPAVGITDTNNMFGALEFFFGGAQRWRSAGYRCANRSTPDGYRRKWTANAGRFPAAG